MRIPKVAPYLAVCLLAALLFPLPVAAQWRPAGFALPTPLPGDVLLPEKEALALSKQLQLLSSPSAAAPLAKELLARYPGRVGTVVDSTEFWPVRRYKWLSSYPERAYYARALVRRAGGDARGAEADLTRALTYALPRRLQASSSADWYDGRTLHILYLVYQARGNLRLDSLHDPTGACADLRRLWQLVAWQSTADKLLRGCSAEQIRRIVVDRQLLAKLCRDSLARLDAAAQVGTPAALRTALRIATHMADGRIGDFDQAPCLLYLETNDPRNRFWDDGEIYVVRADIRERLRDYQGARRDLDTAILLRATQGGNSPIPVGTPGSGQAYYRRGLLRLDHLNDPAGGCADLRIAYLTDTSRVGPTHTRWRGCPMPAYRRPTEKEFARRLADSLQEAQRYFKAGQYERASRLVNNLRRGTAGDLRIGPLHKLDRVYLPQAEMDLLYARAQLRAGESRQAAAILDTAIRSLHQRGGNTWQLSDAYLERATIRLHYLHDIDRGRQDLEQFMRYHAKYSDDAQHVRFPRPLSSFLPDTTLLAAARLDPAQLERSLARKQRWLSRQTDFSSSYGPQFAAFATLRRGPASPGGFLVGLRLKDTDWFGVSPGVGVEVLPRPFIVAPSVWIEAHAVLIGGRVDLTYYRYHGQEDFRLMPQIGLTLAGNGGIYYGRSFALNPRPLEQIGTHRLTLVISIVEMQGSSLGQ